MSDDINTHSKEFDLALGEVLPDDLESELEQDSPAADTGSTDASRWFNDNYTFFEKTPEDVYKEIASDEIQHYADRLGVTAPTPQMAESLFSQYDNSDANRVIVELYAGAAFYCASKVNEEGITPDEVAEVESNLLDRKRLLRRSKRIASTLGLDASVFIDASQYVDRFCERLDASDAVRERAHEIIDRCEEGGIAGGKSPTGWAASAVYLASTELGAGHTQSDVADVAEVTEVTIRNRYSEQQEFLHGDEEVPEHYLDCIGWLAENAEIRSEITSAATTAGEQLEGTTYEISHPESTALADALDNEPANWAGALLLYASRVLDDNIGTRRLTSILETDGHDLNRRVRHLKTALRKSGVDPHQSPDSWVIY